jgi:hypothetical protein
MVFGMTMIDLQQMSREEKLKVMHALWEDLARDEDTVESPEWHQDVLRDTGGASTIGSRACSRLG